MLTAILTRARDSRLVWDLFGPIYNRNIQAALRGLYEHVAERMHLGPFECGLDVGTGPGHVALSAAQRYPSSIVVGVDFSPLQVRRAERIRRREKVENCRFLKADAMRLPFAPESFDAVASVGSIKHWPDARRGLREIFRVLRPGKRAIVAETDREAGREDVKNFVARFSIWYIPGPLLEWGTRRIVFGQSYSEKQIAAFMEEAGFAAVRAERLTGCPYVIVQAVKP